MDYQEAATKLFSGDDISFMIDYGEADHARLIDSLKPHLIQPLNNTQLLALKKYVDLLSNDNVMFLWRLMSMTHTQNTVKLHYFIRDRMIACILELEKKQKNEQRANG
jgi:hypothetical protein